MQVDKVFVSKLPMSSENSKTITKGIGKFIAPDQPTYWYSIDENAEHTLVQNKFQYFIKSFESRFNE